MQRMHTASGDDQVVTTVRLSREQHEALRERAEREHRTFSQELRRLIELSLADEHLEEAA